MDDCIDHGRRLGKDTYAYRWRQGKQYPLHRLVYADNHNINILDMEYDQVVRHTCDNRRCINPNHLVIGTRADNSADMVRRGRFHSVLTQKEALEILVSELSVKTLSEVYNVSRHTIRRIKNKTSWSANELKAATSIREKSNGERNGNSVLTDDQVREILSSEGSQRKIARRFGVSQYTIWSIKNGKTWGSLNL